MKILKPKTIIIILTALVALVCFWLFLNRYLYKPKAAAEKINVTFAPTSGNFKVGEKKTLDVIIQTTDSTKKISGLDLSFTVSGNLSILGLTPSAPYPLPQQDQFKLSQNQIIYNVGEKQARVAYAFLNPDNELPSALILKMDFQGISSGSGTIKIDTGKSQVVGNVTGGLYEFGDVKEANFNFSGAALSPTPTLPIDEPTPTTPISSVTPVPTGNPNCLCLKDDACDTSCVFKELDGVPYIQPKKCSLPSSLLSTSVTQNNKNSWCKRPLRTQGDADGNGVVDKLDYYYYVTAVNGGKIPVSVNPDFNGDGEVGVADRAIVTNTLNSPSQCKVDSDCPQVACQQICEQGKPCPTCMPPKISCINNRCVQLSPTPQPTLVQSPVPTVLCVPPFTKYLATFNGYLYLGDVKPLEYYNVDYRDGKYGQGVWVKPPGGKLIYPALEPNLPAPLTVFNPQAGSVSLFFRPDWDSGLGPIEQPARIFEYGEWTADNSKDFYGLSIGAQGKTLVFQTNNGAKKTTCATVVAGISWKKLEWHHIALVWFTGSVAIYVDGNLANTLPAASDCLPQNQSSLVLSVGAAANGSANSVGTIDNLAIYTRPLLPTEVKCLSQTP